jgi:hypothetical protein
MLSRIVFASWRLAVSAAISIACPGAQLGLAVTTHLPCRAQLRPTLPAARHCNRKLAPARPATFPPCGRFASP